MLPRPIKPFISSTSLEAELKTLVEPLMKQLSEARSQTERDRIQTRIDWVSKVHNDAITRTKVDEKLYDQKHAEYNKQQEAIQVAVRQAEVNELRQQFMAAGGNPDDFESQLPEIERAINQQWILNSIMGEHKPPAL